jgi:hypothetical protein
MDKYTDLDTCFRDVWNKLYRGTVERGNPFRLVTIATTNGTRADSRLVVFRDMDTENGILSCWTDVRSSKVTDLKLFPNMSWCFWSKNQSLQIRVSGSTKVHHQSEKTRQIWDKIAPQNRKDYCAIVAPGDNLMAEKTHPDWWGEEDKMTSEITNYGFENFALISTKIEKIDMLHLHREGHQRALFTLEKGEWKKNWTSP